MASKVERWECKESIILSQGCLGFLVYWKGNNSCAVKTILQWGNSSDRVQDTPCLHLWPTHLDGKNQENSWGSVYLHWCYQVLSQPPCTEENLLLFLYLLLSGHSRNYSIFLGWWGDVWGEMYVAMQPMNWPYRTITQGLTQQQVSWQLPCTQDCSEQMDEESTRALAPVGDSI